MPSGSMRVAYTIWIGKISAAERSFTSTAVSLRKQLLKVRTVAVERAVTSQARAFYDVATAMTAKKRARVHRAIAETQVAYRQLKKVCGPA